MPEIEDPEVLLARHVDDAAKRGADELLKGLNDFLPQFDRWRADAVADGQAPEKIEELLQSALVAQFDATPGAVEMRSDGAAWIAYVCHRVAPAVVPEVRSEAYGRQLRWTVSVGGRYVGAITTWIGDENACILHKTFQAGVLVEIDGDLANAYLCADPAHRAVPVERSN